MKPLTEDVKGKEGEVKERAKNKKIKEYQEYGEGTALKGSFGNRLMRELGIYDSNNEAEMGRLKGYAGDIIIGETAFKYDGKDWKMPLYITYPVSNVPFIPYQPAKRISVIGHSIRTAGIWDNPDKPLIPMGKEHLQDGAINHKVSTLNAKICFAKTEEEILLCEDDSVIISPAFAKRAGYRLIYRALEDEEKPLLLRHKADMITGDRQVKKGMHLMGMYRDSNDVIERFLYEQSEIRHSGLLIPREIMTATKKITTDKNGDDTITEELFAQAYNIIQADNIGVGDKLLFLSGCKGVVADIRELPDKADIMLSKLSVWNADKESSQRGALLKEMEVTGGYGMIFYQPEHLRINEAIESTKDPKLSTTLYPFLMESPYLRDNLEVNNEDLPEILKMAGLELVEEDSKVILRELVVGDSKIEQELIYKGVYVPKFIRLYYTRQMKHQEYIIRRTGIFNALMTEKRATLKRSVQSKIRNLIRPTSPGIKGLVAIPHNGNYNEIRLNPKTAKELKENVLVYREPVCEHTSIQHLTVKPDKDTPLGCAKVHPYAMRLFNGDMDGDKLYVLNIGDTFFKVSTEDYKAKARKSEVKQIPEGKRLKPKSIPEMVADAKAWHKKSVKRAVDTSLFGGRIKECTLKYDNIGLVADKILPYAGALEGSLKDSKVKALSGNDKVSLREKFYEMYERDKIGSLETTPLQALMVKGKVEKPAEGKSRSMNQWIAQDLNGKVVTTKTGMFVKWFKASHTDVVE